MKYFRFMYKQSETGKTNEKSNKFELVQKRLNMLFNKKESTLYSVCDGEIIPISLIDDEAISQGFLGQGYGVKPKSDHILSPADGTVISVSDTKHAYTLSTEDGAEILIHIGIDTVELNGEGFTPMVSSGQRVKRGEEIAIARIDVLKDLGYKTDIAVIITNCDEYKIENMYFGFAKGGDAVALSYRKISQS